MLTFGLILAVIIGTAIGLYQAFSKSSRLREEAKALNLKSEPSEPRPASTSFVRKQPQKPINHELRAAGLRFAVSADRKTAYLLYDTDKQTLTVPTEKITGCRILKNGFAPNVTGAAVGGALAGDAGMLIGAFSGPQIPYSMSLVITLKDPWNPRVEYSLMNSSTLHTQTYYSVASTFAKSVTDTIRALIAQNRTH